MIKISATFLALLSVFVLLAGCSSNALSSTSTSVVKTYDDNMVKNILVSLGKNDYDGFSADFDNSLKNILTRAVFDQLHNQVTSNLGEYQSMISVSTAVQGANTTVLYLAQYTAEPAGVAVTVIFQAANGTNYIHGVNLDSPKLRGQSIDIAGLRAYADPITENILVSLKNNDFAGFSRDLDEVMRKAEDETAFNSIYTLLKTNVGDYISKDFKSAAIQQNYFVVRYLAKYDNEPDGVWITISFDKNQQVAGLYFNSPKLAPK